MRLSLLQHITREQVGWTDVWPLPASNYWRLPVFAGLFYVGQFNSGQLATPVHQITSPTETRVLHIQVTWVLAETQSKGLSFLQTGVLESLSRAEEWEPCGRASASLSTRVYSTVLLSPSLLQVYLSQNTQLSQKEQLFLVTFTGAPIQELPETGSPFGSPLCAWFSHTHRSGTEPAPPQLSCLLLSILSQCTRKHVAERDISSQLYWGMINT